MSPLNRPSLPRKVDKALLQHHMPRAEIVVAVSGGADSICLLRALVELGCKPIAAHLNHGLRPEAADDAAFVRETCERLAVRCVLEERDVLAHQRERRLSLETAAREVRHAFLRSVAAAHGAAAIFLAHTANDQVETFLLRLIRGAGVAGLQGMRPVDGLLCRPLLDAWRPEIEEWLREIGQPWREDASNKDPRFLRNRIRHEVIPLLRELNPGIDPVILRETKLLADRQRQIDGEVLRRTGLESRQIDAVMAGSPVTVRSGLRISVERVSEPLAVFHQGIELTEMLVPGQVDLPGIGILQASESAPTAAPRDIESLAGGYAALLDLDETGRSLTVRSRRPGDRFMPLGMKHEKKLQDFLVDAKVPRSKRDRLPLVLRNDSIVWVAGMRIDERYKATAATRRLALLRFFPIVNPHV